MNPQTTKLLILGIILAGVSIVVPVLAVNTIIDNTSVSTTMLNTVNEAATGNVSSANVTASQNTNTHNLTVTGTCTGCGSIEANYNTYSLVLNSTIAGTGSNDAVSNLVSNTGSVMYFDDGAFISYIKLNGVVVSIAAPSDFAFLTDGGKVMDQSFTGMYRATLLTNNTITIYKNDVVIQHIALDQTHCFTNASGDVISLSPNGKYLAITGKNVASSQGFIQIWQG